MLHPTLSNLHFQDGTATPVPSAPTTTSQTTPATGTPGEEGGAPPPGGLMSWLPFVAIFAVVWFMMINPERKNRKKRDAMLSELKKGDKVLSAAGIYGTIVQIQDQIVTLQIADGVRVRMNRGSIQQLENEGAETAQPAKA